MKLFKLNMLDEWINGFYPRISFSVGGSKTSTKSSQEVNRNTEAELLGVSTGTQATKSKTAKEEATDTDKSTKAVSTAEQTSQTQQQVQSIAQLLDTETQDLIKSLVGQLSQDIGGNDEADLLSSLLSERSQTAEGDVLAQIGPIIANARREGERQLIALQTQLAQQAGGSLANTGVVTATAEGRAGLETQLADLEAKLNIGARDKQTEELQGAFAAVSAPDQQQASSGGLISNLLNILKGAQAKQTETGATQATAKTREEQLVNELLSSFTSGGSSTDTLQTLLETVQQLQAEKTKETTQTSSKSGKMGFSLGI